MGIKVHLNLKGNEFSNTASWFFIAYLIAEVPNGESIPCIAYAILSHHITLRPPQYKERRR